MANLAIGGHSTRGREVITWLEMLGGENRFQREGDNEHRFYYIDKNKRIQITCGSLGYILFDLEEFEKLYPYKVGDKVTNEYRLPMIIFDIYWDNDFNVIKYNVRFLDDDKTVRTGLMAEELQPYEEENYCQVIGNDTSSNGVNTFASLIKEETMGEKEPEPKAPILSNRYDYAEGKCGYVIPDGYEFDCIKEGFQTEIILKPKKPQYPKTYEECCEVLGIEEDLRFVYEDIDGNHINPACISNYRIRRLNLYHNFEKLSICRDAYWKIAGKQLGLDKPWKPEWNNGHFEKYYIYLKQNEIEKSSCFFESHFLAFPTEAMRDAFCENFKDLIEECKELL